LFIHLSGREFVVSVVVSDSVMTVPGSSVRAVRGDVPGAEEPWSVSWLPGRVFTRSQATTAMVLASILSAGPVTDRLSPHVRGWAAELGLTSAEAADAFAVAVQGGPEASVRVVDEAEAGPAGEDLEWSRAVSSARKSTGEWLDRSALPPGPEWDRIAEDAVRANAEAFARLTLSARRQAAVRGSLEEAPVAEAQEF
jgi:hypothetical protein